MAFKIKKDDTVLILTGKDKGKKGKVISCQPKTNRVIVEGVNVVTKHVKPRKQGEAGGRITTEAAINASNVMPICPKCDKATRVSYKIEADKKSRVCKKCSALLDN